MTLSCPYRVGDDDATVVDVGIGELPRRRSVRLAGFDYQGNFACLVTICTEGREASFGRIADGRVVLSPLGSITDKCLRNVSLHATNVVVDTYTVQPDHVHAVLVFGQWTGENKPFRDAERGPLPAFGKVPPGSLPAVVRSFKGAVTRRAATRRLADAPWQRGYDDSVLPDLSAFLRARAYVLRHPPSW
jgi:hypothetical protein